MAFKFNEITFDLKDILLIVGLVAGYFNFKSEQKELYSELKSEIRQMYQIDLDLVTEEFKRLRIAFPEDTIRYKNDFVLVIN